MGLKSIKLRLYNGGKEVSNFLLAQGYNEFESACGGRGWQQRCKGTAAEGGRDLGVSRAATCQARPELV